MELIKVTGNTYYIDSPSKVGIYLNEDNSVYLIDSSNDDRAGKKILSIIENMGWSVRAIINTHSHADHIGGNAVIQKKTGCKIYANKEGVAFIQCPKLEPAIAYGGYPCKDISHKFMVAQESVACDVALLNDSNISILDLKGHSWDMIGVMTSDGVLFAGDGILGEETVEKYGVFYVFDVKAYIDTLDIISNCNAKMVVMSHGKARQDVVSLVEKNKKQINEVVTLLLNICQKPMTQDEIIKAVFDNYGISMNFTQHILIGSVLRSYLACLADEGKIAVDFTGNIMKWKTI